MPDRIYHNMPIPPESDTPQKLIETVRERLIRIMDNGTSKTFAGDIYEDADAVNAREANIALSKLEAALGEKTVPLDMLLACFWARPLLKDKTLDEALNEIAVHYGFKVK